MRRDLWVIFAAALALRLLMLGSYPFWYDEVFTAQVARLGPEQAQVALAGDVHPTVWYTIEMVAVRMLPLDLEAALRLPALLLSMVALWLLYQVGLRLSWPPAALRLALWFMALSPFHIFYAQEARMYALLTVEVLALLLLLLERRWWYAGVVVYLTLNTHNYAVFYLPLLALAALWEYSEDCRATMHEGKIVLFDLRPYWRLLAVFALPGLVYALTWLPVLLGQMGTVAQGYWIQPPDLGDVLETWYYNLAGYSIPKTMFVPSILLVFGACMVAAVRVWRRRERPEYLPLVLLMGLAPYALSFALSHLWEPVFLLRGFIACTPFLFLALALGLYDLGPLLRRAALVMALPVLLVSLVTYYWIKSPKADSLETISRMDAVAAQVLPGDRVVHMSGVTVPSWAVYEAWSGPPYLKLAPCGEFEAQGQLSPLTQVGLGIVEVPWSVLESGRTWLIVSIGPLHHECYERELAPILAQAELVETLRDDPLARAEIWLYEP